MSLAKAHREAERPADLFRVVCEQVAHLGGAVKGAILIPFPYAAADHQTANARALDQAKAACMLPQGEMTAEALAGMAIELLGDRTQLEQMAANGLKLGKPGATELILAECDRLLAKGENS